MTKKTTRVQLELPEKAFERLQSLRDKTEAVSYAEVLKNALRLYEALLQEAEAGNEVCVKYANGREVAYKVIF